MKKISVCRFLALALVLAIMVGAFNGVTVKAATAEEVVRIYVESYNDSVVLRDGEKVTESLIQRLGIILKGQTDSGKVVPLPIQIKEKGTYIHAVKGKVKFTLYYGDVTKSLSVKVKVKAKKLTVKVKKNATLPEGQKLTMGMVNSVFKATLAYEDGKKVKSFKGYLCKQIGSTIKANKKGNIKLTAYVSGVKKTVSVKVNRIKRIYIGKTVYSEEFEGEKISPEKFRSKNEVRAAYKKGGNKKLLTYGISVKGDVVTVKYGRFSDTIKFKRVTKPAVAPTPAPTPAQEVPSTQAPTEEPTLVPTEEPTSTPVPTQKPTAEPTVTPSEKPEVPTATPTAVPTAEPTAKPTAKPTAVPTAEPTAKPTAKPTAVPTAEPTAKPTEKPTAKPTGTPVPTVEPTVAPTATPVPTETPIPTPLPKLTLSVEGEGSFFINDEEVEAGEISLESGSYRLRVEEKLGYEFDSIQDGEGNVLTDKNVYTFNITEDTTIHVVFAKLYTVTLNRGIGKVAVDGADAIFQNGIATMEVREGSELTLSTSSTSEYRFTRYASSIGTELSTEGTYKFTVTSDISIVAVFEKLYAFTVKREGLGGVNIGEGDEAKPIRFTNNSYEVNVVTGNQTLTAVENDDWYFLGWFYENSSRAFSTKLSVTVPINVATTVVAKFAETEKTVTVQYVTDDGSVLKTDSVPFGSSLEPPVVNGAAGLVFAGWQIAGTETSDVYRPNGEGDFVLGTKKLAEAIGELTAEKKAVTVVAVFEAEPTKYFSLAVSGASVTSFEDGEKDAEGNYSDGTHIFCDAVVPEGYSVEGWYDTTTGEKVRGPYTTYEFHIQKNTSIEARFTKDEVEPEPILTWKNYEPDFDKKMLVLIPNVQIPKKYEIIKWGVLMTSKDESEIPDSELKVGNTKLLDVQAKKELDDETGEEYYPSNHTVTISQSWASVFNNGKTVRVLIYATIDDGTGSKTIYSSKPVTINCATVG